MITLILDENKLDTAKSLLEIGEIVAIPTETVYGLAANALNPHAISKIFSAKGRPQDNPLIVHISNYEMLNSLVAEIPEKAKILMDNFWGGPLTLVFKKSDLVPDEISKGLDTVAIRFPSHKLTLDLIELCGFPLAAPSANISGRPSTTTFEHVLEDLNGKIAGAIKDKPCEIGLESTVLDVTSEPFRLLRPGGVTAEQIEQFVGKIVTDKAVLGEILDTQKVSSPGMKYKHYAPKADLVVLCGNPDKTAKYIAQNASINDGILCFDEYEHYFFGASILTFGSKNDISSQANLLFDKLRIFDLISVEKIYAQCPSDIGLGLAVTNRMKKASGFNVLDLGQKIIGITGNSGSGKTTFTDFAKENGYEIVDCDEVYHNLLENNADMLSELFESFPQAFENNVINLKKLGELVFENSEKLEQLNAITHKFVKETCLDRIKNAKTTVIFDVPLMFESGFNEYCDIVVGILSKEENKTQRIISRDNISHEYASARLKNQKNDSFYMANCDIIIENDGEINDFKQKILEILKGE